MCTGDHDNTTSVGVQKPQDENPSPTHPSASANREDQNDATPEKRYSVYSLQNLSSM